MNNLKIHTKSKTLLINEFGKHTNLEFIDIKDIAKTNLDVYFHSGTIDENTKELVSNSKKVIVNSNSARIEILEKTDVDRKKVFIVYPGVKPSSLKSKEAKKQLCKELECDKKTRFIFFTARNLKTNGVKELFDALLALNNDNFKVIIASNKEQIDTLKFQIAKFKISDKVVFYEDFKNMDLLYAASDIFVLPTYVKNFSINVLKAMASKNAVFVSSNNSAREIVDVFSTMESPTDPNTSFKIDALLRNKDELKLIKKQNLEIAKRFFIKKQIQRLLVILNIT